MTSIAQVVQLTCVFGAITILLSEQINILSPIFFSKILDNWENIAIGRIINIRINTLSNCGIV